MQRLINDPDMLVEDMLPGFIETHKKLVHLSAVNSRVVVSNYTHRSPKVGIVTGGGSGHWPAFIGYCGENMVDAVAVGEIFSSPTAKAFEQAIAEADQGKGVAVLYGNYAGDTMNVSMALRKVQKQGIDVGCVVATDDVASAQKTEREKRRGVAGEVFMWKIAGAKAATGASLEDVIASAQKAIDATRSIGVGLSPCTIPSSGKPNFAIKPGTMELGIGHHGEPGICVEPLKDARGIADEMVVAICSDMPFVRGDEVAVLISGLGATPVMEQFIFSARVYDNLRERGICVYDSLVGNYFTSLEMNGITLTITKLDDDLKQCLDLPVNTPAFVRN